VFGFIFAAFANIGQTHFVFTCNAVSDTPGFQEEFCADFPRGCCNFRIYYFAVLQVSTRRE
jgi:hypothetical protein